MSDTPFHATRMGARYYESTVPALVRQLELLNRNLERLNDTLNLKHGDDPNGHDPRDEEEAAPPHP